MYKKNTETLDHGPTNSFRVKREKF